MKTVLTGIVPAYIALSEFAALPRKAGHESDGPNWRSRLARYPSEARARSHTHIYQSEIPAPFQADCRSALRRTCAVGTPRPHAEGPGPRCVGRSGCRLPSTTWLDTFHVTKPPARALKSLPWNDDIDIPAVATPNKSNVLLF